MSAAAAKCRNYPGCRLEEFDAFPVREIQDMDALAVPQYIQTLLRADPAKAARAVELPDGIQSELWLYEHLRQFCIDLNALVLATVGDCNCAEMSAGPDVTFLCAAHGEPLQCTAINYEFHTIDHATATLTSSKTFPSRLLISENGAKQLQTVAKRLYRIFAHIGIHHREVFSEFELKTRTYERFLRLNRVFELVPADLLQVEEVCGTALEQLLA